MVRIPTFQPGRREKEADLKDAASDIILLYINCIRCLFGAVVLGTNFTCSVPSGVVGASSDVEHSMLPNAERDLFTWDLTQ